MSHFTVAVFTEPNGKTVDELLAPYHEFECTGRNDQYVIEVDETEEKRKDYESNTRSMCKHKITGELKNRYDDIFHRYPTEEESKKIGKFAGTGCGHGLSWTSKNWKDGKGYRPKVHFIPEEWEEVEIPFTELYSFSEYLEEYEEISKVPFGEEIDIEKEHKYHYFIVDEKDNVIKVIRRTNPNSKWDWYQIGGRWQGILKLKEGATGKIGKVSLLMDKHEYKEEFIDSAKIKDIDFSIDKESEKYKKAIRFWELKIDKQEPITEEDKKQLEWDWYKDEYYIERYKDKYDYADQICSISTYAVITSDGVWHSKGDIGWWAYSSETGEESRNWDLSFYDKFIKNSDPEITITIVDCHI